MNTCRTCLWHEQKRPADSNGGFCDCPKLYESHQYPDGEEPYGRDHLVYSYYEGGAFWTGDDFGCVHHQPRNET